MQLVPQLLAASLSRHTLPPFRSQLAAATRLTVTNSITYVNSSAVEGIVGNVGGQLAAAGRAARQTDREGPKYCCLKIRGRRVCSGQAPTQHAMMGWDMQSGRTACTAQLHTTQHHLIHSACLRCRRRSCASMPCSWLLLYSRHQQCSSTWCQTLSECNASSNLAAPAQPPCPSNANCTQYNYTQYITINHTQPQRPRPASSASIPLKCQLHTAHH